MCGRPLVETRPEPPAVRSEPAVTRDPEPPSPAPAYTGGLFNLGAPADKPHRDLDYLLEDDEEKSSNKGLILLTLVALALVIGLGWLRWRNGGFPFLKSLTSTSQAKPTPSQDSTPADSAPPASDAPSPGANAGSPAPSASEASAPTAATTPPGTDSMPVPAPQAAQGNQSSPAASTPDPNAAATATSPAPSAPDPAVHESTTEGTRDKSSERTVETVAPPAPAPTKPQPVVKPAPKPAVKSTDPVQVGERYLYGKEGFPQNCERGLHYVKPAADQSNPKAMFTMGALYATGHCLSKDLPTAYRYFALALRGDPENGPLRQNAEMVWKQMTAEERKQAIRMTQ
jgi:hypothetical protein